MNSYSIRAENLSKNYPLNRGKSRIMFRQVLQDAVSSLFSQNINGTSSKYGDSRDNSVFWALQNISFEVQVGESIGIIGSNGAGKSTLLKLLARVTVPSQGKVRLRGRVGSLLEVGTGFHQELTGRENIYLNGAILGMHRQEIDRKFDEIVDFSEVEEFLDIPVKFFSSGMKMRLAFSVAAHLEPEILLVDEVLAVGDLAFQRKSLSKMENVIGQGRTVLFVSHNMAVVRSLCKKGLYIEKGFMKYFGEMKNAIGLYLNTNERQNLNKIQLEPNPNKQVQIMEIGLNGSGLLPHDLPFEIKISVAIRRPVYRLSLALLILDEELNPIINSYDFDRDEKFLQVRQPGNYTYLIKIPPALAPGRFRLTVQARQLSHKRDKLMDSIESVCPFELYDNGSARSRANLSWNSKLSTPLLWELADDIN